MASKKTVTPKKKGETQTSGEAYIPQTRGQTATA